MTNKVHLLDQLKVLCISLHCFLGTASMWVFAETAAKILAVVLNLVVAGFTIYWLRQKITNAKLENRERSLSIEQKEKELKKP